MPTVLDITTEYFVCGDFDSRKRYLRENASGSIALCSGITWELGSGLTTAGSPWQPYHYKIDGRVDVPFESYTFSGTTANQAVTNPVNIVTGMSF